MTSRKKLGVAFWATVVNLTMMLYPLSLGPVEWLYVHSSQPDWMRTAGHQFYSPLHSLTYGPTWLRESWISYRDWCGDNTGYGF